MSDPRPPVYRHCCVQQSPWQLLDLTLALVVREFKGQYRRSLLGPAWAVLQPLAYLAIFLLLRGILEIPSDGLPYPLFALSALAPWIFFANAVTRCAPSVVANAGILKKVAAPKEVFPLAAMLAAFFDFLVAVGLLAVALLWFGAPLSWQLWWLPFLVLLTACLALGVGMAVAALGTFKRDIIFAMPFLMQFWLLATPVMYPLGAVPEGWRTLYFLNPMVGIVEGVRMVVVQGVAPDPGLVGLSCLGVALVWCVAWPLFRTVSQYFADVL